MTYVERVLADIIKKNPAQDEYIQATTEVLRSIEPVLDAHPEYEANALLERLTEPERIIIFRVPCILFSTPSC